MQLKTSRRNGVSAPRSFILPRSQGSSAAKPSQRIMGRVTCRLLRLASNPASRPSEVVPGQAADV
eukprot:365847-Chlamydomonas_euryale.AAC.21